MYEQIFYIFPNLFFSKTNNAKIDIFHILLYIFMNIYACLYIYSCIIMQKFFTGKKQVVHLRFTLI